MSVTVSQGEGVTVITITSNPNSKWPILCQILGTLCYSPVCAVSQHVKAKMGSVYARLAIVQFAVGIIFTLTENSGYIRVIADAPFCFGGVFIVVGIVSFVAAWFPSSFLLLITVGLNMVSTVVAAISLALFSCDLLSSIPVSQQRNAMSSGSLWVLDVAMWIFSVLEICVTLGFSILAVKLFDTNVFAKSVKEPQFYKPLKEVTVSHV
ncbi:membrane-spanning 4-domains subfamily A member 4D-like [Pseudorasbora parva]|uniref:membrane-spanning 4-domains subfamily A member 4D-like n=1 Tax=Pseudorasbora parva TaxID=51549 RepID=UPI00351E5C57